MKRSLTEIDRENERMINLIVGTGSPAERIPVYNQLLRNASPVFKTRVESMGPEGTEMMIPGVSQEVMSILIQYIYATFGDLEAVLPITNENVHALSFAANKFELADVQSLCDDFLECIEVNAENCLQFFATTSESTSANFRKKCLELVLSSLAQLLNTQPFFNLSFTQFREIIHTGYLYRKCSEEILCQAAINWLKHQSRDTIPRLKELIDDFSLKAHKRQILQALHATSNLELQKMAFDLLMNLYTEETKILRRKLATAHQIPTESDTIQNERPSATGSGEHSSNSNGKTVNGSNDSARNGHNACSSSSARSYNDDEAVGHYYATRLVFRRSPRPAPLSKRRYYCSKIQKKFKPPIQMRTMVNCKSFSVATKSSSKWTGSRANGAVGTKNGRCSVSSAPIEVEIDEGCSIYFLVRHESYCNLMSFNLHTLELRRIETTIPTGLSIFDFTSLQYYNGRIYFIGGKYIQNYSRSSNKAYIFNMARNSWTLKEMREPRHDCQSVRLGSWMFVIGGRQKLHDDQAKITFLDTVERFRLDTDEAMEKWIPLEEKPKKPRINCGVVAFNNRIYTVGGFTMEENMMTASGICEVFDPDAVEQKWTVLKAVLSVPRYGIATVATETAIYAIGGMTEDIDRLTTVDILREGSSVWEVGPNLVKARAHASAAYCKEKNAIFVFGGDYCENSSVEQLDLVTNKWTLINDKTSDLGDYKSFFSVAFQPCD